MSGANISVELELKAYHNSTEEIATLLDSTSQLDSMDVIITRVNQKLATLQTQLGAVMQTQLDELTDSLNIVREIHDRTINMRSRFNEVRSNCAESLRSLESNKQIDKLYLARKNVFSVVNQLKFMEELPDRIRVMTARLNEDYTALRIIYDEWIGYNSWMWKVKEHIEEIQDEERRNITTEIYQECFEAIESLGRVIEDKLWEHIYRCMELAQQDPAALVRALTIIEKSQRRKERARELHNRGEKVANWVLNDRDWVDECKDRLLTAIQRRCEHAYNQGSTMKDKLRIGMQLLADLDMVRTKVVPCFPPHYNILQFFITQYAVIANNNMECYYNDPTIEPGDILVLVEWLDSFCEEVASWGGESVPVFVEAKERLLEKFKISCSCRMEMWFKRILERNDPPMESDEGCLVTAAPEDIFSLIKTQAELASEHLKDEVLCRVIKICTDPIQIYTEFYQKRITEDIFDCTDRELCALINNNNHLREMVEDLPGVLMLDLSTEEVTVEMNMVLTNATAPLLELNNAIAHALSDMIIGDIDSSRVLETMCFNEEWLYQEEADGILTMTSTFQDYFNDLQVWIQSRTFYSMIVIDCLHNSVKRYFNAFSHSSNSFDDCMTLGCRIKADYDCLMSYFTNDAIANVMKYSDRRYRNGDFIAEVLSPIRNLEIFYKSPAEMIIMNGEITNEGYQMILSLVGGKMMDNGIVALMMSRGDFEPDERAIIITKFSRF